MDFHTHVGFLHAFPGSPTPLDSLGLRLLAVMARYHRMDAVVITNHDYYRDYGDTVCGVRVLPGIEVSTTHGHVLVIGPDPPMNTAPGTLSPAEVVEVAHDRGCVAIIPHPFRNSTVRKADVPFDAIEINGKHPRYRTQVEGMARERGVPLIGGSDAHFPFEAGRAFTLVDSDELSSPALVNAVRDGRVQPVVRETWLIRLIRRWYARVHRIRSCGLLSESLRHRHP